MNEKFTFFDGNLTLDIEQCAIIVKKLCEEEIILFGPRDEFEDIAEFRELTEEGHILLEW